MATTAPSYFATEKANSIARQINDDLTLRVARTVALSTDTNGFATVTVGTATAGQQNAFIRVLSAGTLNTDSLGLTQRVYSPHIIQLVLETSSVANVPLLTGANMALILPELTQFGTRVELYLTSNGTNPSVSGITGAPTQVWDSLYQPLTSTI